MAERSRSPARLEPLRHSRASTGRIPGLGMVLILALVMVTSAPVKALDAEDSDLAIKVKSEMVRNEVVDHARIEVSADDGLVVLTGTVLSMHEKNTATAIALRYPGVLAVSNRLKVTAE